MKKTNSTSVKGHKKEVRKPVSTNFAPKRLAINFQPPTIILEYLVIDTGKLYHHKMRLDSILRKQNINRYDVLNYVKTKHYLYFLNTKLKDQQILKFIDKILHRLGKAKPSIQKIEQINKHLKSSPSAEIAQNCRHEQDDDFDYLNDDDEYEEDYEDYEEEPQPPFKTNKQNNQYKPQVITSSFTTKTLEKSSISPQQSKNTFMTYCQEEYDDENEEEGQANWDLDIDENADFDFV